MLYSPVMTLMEEGKMKATSKAPRGSIFMILAVIFTLAASGCLEFQATECQSDRDCDDGHSCVAGVCERVINPDACDQLGEAGCLERDDCEAIYIHARCGAGERCVGAVPEFDRCREDESPPPPVRCEELGQEECQADRRCELQEICAACLCACQPGEQCEPCDCFEQCQLVCVPRHEGCEDIGDQHACQEAGCQWVVEGPPCYCAQGEQDRAGAPGGAPEIGPPCECPVWERCEDPRPRTCEQMGPDHCLANPDCELLDVCMPCACAVECPEGEECPCEPCGPCEQICVTREEPMTCEELGPGECLDHPECELTDVCGFCDCTPCPEGERCGPCECDAPCELVCTTRQEPRPCEHLAPDDCEASPGCALVDSCADTCDCPEGEPCPRCGAEAPPGYPCGLICMPVKEDPCLSLDEEDCLDTDACEWLEADCLCEPDFGEDCDCGDLAPAGVCVQSL